MLNIRAKATSEVHLKAIDFFCGAGGVTLGFLQAGIEVIAGIDIDVNCKETYEKNNQGAKFIHADISSLTPEELENELNIHPNDDNLIFIGCSPCQYYTIINTDKEKSSKSKMLLEDFRRFVTYFKPGYIFIENVPGIKNKEGSPLFEFKTFLVNNEYAIDDKIVNAIYYKVPQTRRRYVLIATRVSQEIKIPKPITSPDMTVRNFIGSNEIFTPIQAGHNDNTSFMHTALKLSATNLRRLELTPQDGGTRLAWNHIPELQLKCYEGKDDIFRNVYGRVFWDKPSPTITTRFTSISNGRFAHPEQNRGISIREGATLQTFPYTYQFYSRAVEVIARMIGNAVPPAMAKIFGEAIIENRLNLSTQLSIPFNNVFNQTPTELSNQSETNQFLSLEKDQVDNHINHSIEY